MFTTDEKIKEASTIKNDYKMIFMSVEDSIAKEAYYHATCYRSSTPVNYDKDNDEGHIQEDEENNIQ